MARPGKDRLTRDARHAGRVALAATRRHVAASLLSALLMGTITLAGQLFVLAPAMTKRCTSMVDLEAAVRLHDQHKLDARAFDRTYRRATQAGC
jgi:hypothetical protein